jgi:hypothetical protein
VGVPQFSSAVIKCRQGASVTLRRLRLESFFHFFTHLRRYHSTPYNLTNGSLVFFLFIAPRPLWTWLIFQFLNYKQLVVLLGRGISPSQGRYLHTEQHKHRINAHTDIHASSGIRTHFPSVRVGEVVFIS